MCYEGESQIEFLYPYNSTEDLIALMGPENLLDRIVRDEFGVSLTVAEEFLKIQGGEEEALRVKALLDILLQRISSGDLLEEDSLRLWCQAMKAHPDPERLIQDLQKTIALTFDQKLIKAKTLGQLLYIDALRQNDLIFATGPAGTGKTFLAVLAAVEALKGKKVKRIILVRPAVEAGEQLGFLPGDLQEKIQPYIRPLYDNLYELLGVDQVERLIERKIIEIAPLAYMRGRTLEDSFIILDEAQNTTVEQMKMFLTRFGFRSKVVVTGDPTQNDLRKGEASGLNHSLRILKGIPGIKEVQLTGQDVVRHPLVRKIIKAFEEGAE